MAEARLVSARMLSATVRELTFDGGAGFTFTPGQWVNLHVDRGGERIRRAYSIASEPRRDGTFDLAVTSVENGIVSTFLHAAQPGVVLERSDAQGYFTLAPPVRPVLLVGTGTGVAPLRSMLRALAQAPLPNVPFSLVFGVRTESDILYDADFRELGSRWPGFVYAPTLSRGSPAWTGRRGYVQTHLRDLVASLGGDCDAYVCGLNRMVAQARRVLREEIGLDKSRVHTERYD